MRPFNSRGSAADRWATMGGLIAAVAVLLAGSGCAFTEGGPGASMDQHTYVSTSWQPKTISLRDTRTGQIFWSIDIPVGKQLVLRFRKDEGSKNEVAPDLMKWDIMDDSKSFGDLNNSMAVPGKDSRRLEMTLRPTPELPPEMGVAKPAPSPGG